MRTFARRPQLGRHVHPQAARQDADRRQLAGTQVGEQASDDRKLPLADLRQERRRCLDTVAAAGAAAGHAAAGGSMAAT
jgi:hypothetical protein